MDMEHKMDKKLTLIVFSASFCAPCRTLKPVLAKIEEEYKDVHFRYIDIEKNTKLTKKYHVKCVPTLILLVNGVEEERMEGLVPYMRKKIEALLFLCSLSNS